MRILYLCPDLGIPVLGGKGASVHVRSMVAAFTRAGHEVVLASPLLLKSPWDRPSSLEGTLLHLPPSEQTTAAVLSLKAFAETLGGGGALPGEIRRILSNQELAVELKRRFEHHPPDFVYERAAIYATAGGQLARSLEVPHVVELNAPLSLEQSTYRGTGLGDLAAVAEQWTLATADAVVVVSSPLASYVQGLGVDGERVHVVANGVDPELFHPSPPGAEEAGTGFGPGPVIGFVGGLRPWHGVECLPELLERLLVDHPDARLLVVGEGPLRAPLEDGLARRGLGSKAHLAGAVPHDEVPRLIRAMDVALAPYEPPAHDFYFSPLKLFEYLACGVPVVGAGVGQIADVVEDGVTGLLYPPGDIDALTAACRLLLGCDELRARLGAAGAKAVLAEHTWAGNAARVLRIATGLMG